MWWIQRKMWCTTRKEEMPDVEWSVGKGSADGDGGVRNEIEGRKYRPMTAARVWRVPGQQNSPPIQSSTEQKGRYIIRAETEGLLIEVEEGIGKRWSQWRTSDKYSSTECWMKYYSAKQDWGAPTGIRDDLVLLRSMMEGGGVWRSPPCGIDEGSGFCSDIIYHCGRAKFTLIFILRKHNCNLLSSGIHRQHAMKCCSQRS